MKKLPLLALSVIGSLSSVLGQATTVSTDPVGFVSVSIPAESDSILAVPLNRAPVYQGMIDSISGNVITVKGTTGWTADQFVYNGTTQTSTFAVQVATGAKEGMIGKVTANAAGTLTVQLDSTDNFTGVVGDQTDGVSDSDGDQVTIMPYWTPSSLFSNVPSSGVELFFVAPTDVGVNLSPNTIYEYAGTNWLDQNSGSPVGSAALQFGQAFIIRNSTASPITNSFVGTVPMTTSRVLIKTLAANTPQDNKIGFASPVPETVGNTNFGAVAGDELHVFNNALAQYNKAPSTILEFTGTLWLNQDTGQNVTNTFMLTPGQGYLLRRIGTAQPNTYVATGVPSYLAP